VPPLLQRRWARWLLVFGVWTLIALFDASQSYLLLHFFVERKLHDPPPMSLGKILILSLTDWYAWALLAPFLVWIARRYPLDQQRWLRSLFALVLWSVFFALVKVATEVPVQALVRDANQWGALKWASIQELFLIFFAAHFLVHLLIAWAILAISLALDYYRKYRERELTTSQLEGRLAQAQLQVLKMQLHPHFLFNTLNAVSALMHQDVELADRMLARLADLLRLTLENAGMQEVPLRQELEFIEPYLEIQKARLGSRLQVRLEIDPETMDAYVPNLVLQPLVENAIQHGIAPRPAGGRIEVRSRLSGELLQLEVADDGPGLPAGALDASKGVGLANTRARLQQLYGEAHRLTLDNRPAGGLAVLLSIPFHEGPVNGAPDNGTGES
jgi:two-component system, LytTR family, sensor kinase